jgi:alkaline phosphatase D
MDPRTPRRHDDETASRRRFLLWAGAGLTGLTAGLLTAGDPLAYGAALLRRPRFAADPFTLGVASGEPAPDGVVLWTRLAPDPLNGGGMPPEDVTVRWEVAKDEKMRQVVKSGTAVAPAALGHSVHVELSGLEPARWYWYRFTAGDAQSPVGRTRTAPAAGAAARQLRLAFASCQNWPAGYFTAYRHMAAEELDLVVHLGDYIYEGGVGNGDGPRKHNGPEITSLQDYRNRYALYKSDPDLQAAHAAFPFVVTWDDHEVENNYANLARANRTPPGDFKARRAAAYQAYYEHQPLRRSSLPMGADMQLFRRLSFGNLAEFHVLDTRQYRTKQPKQDDRRDPAGTITGPTQEKWLTDGLAASRAHWNVLAQQVFLAQRDLEAGPAHRFSTDAWDGYVASRDRLLAFLGERKPSNPVVLTGDVHANWVADLKADFDDSKSATLGTEFVGTSISSGGDGTEAMPANEAALAENPHIKFHNRQRGYVRCTVTPEKWTSDYRVVPYVRKPGAPVTTRATFVVEDGKPGVQRA